MFQNSVTLDFFSLLRPIGRPKIWAYLSYINVISEYRRTLLGPTWIALSLIIFTVSIGSVYSGLLSVDYFDYIAYMATGMIAWNWAAGILVSSGLVYVSQAGLLMDHPIDKAYLIWSHTMNQLFVFMHQLPVIMLFYLFNKIPLNLNILYLIPSLCLVFIINIGVAAVLSIAVARYRDLQKILSSLVIVIMIFTPIFWKAEMVSGNRELLYQLNPFYYIIEMIRTPLLGNAPDPQIYLVTGLMAVSLLLLGCFFYARYSKYVVFRL